MHTTQAVSRPIPGNFKPMERPCCAAMIQGCACPAGGGCPAGHTWYAHGQCLCMMQDGLRVLGLEAEPSSGLVLEDSPSGIKVSEVSLQTFC